VTALVASSSGTIRAATRGNGVAQLSAVENRLIIQRAPNNGKTRTVAPH
jgi:hypothetical protein